MAVGIRAKFAGGTQQQYDAIQGHVGVEDDPPEGMIFHSAGPIEGGWGVIDFWETREAFDRFFESRLRHTIEEVGDQGSPVRRTSRSFRFTTSPSPKTPLD